METENIPTLKLQLPSSHGFLLLATNLKTSSLLDEMKPILRDLKREQNVLNVNIFESIFSSAPFNIVILIESQSVKDALILQSNAKFNVLRKNIAPDHSVNFCLVAANMRRIGDVDRSKQGIFIFNFYKASRFGYLTDEIEKDILGWEKDARWFQQAGLDNSLLLAPVDGWDSEYTIVNHARWNQGGLWNIFSTILMNPKLRNQAENSKPTMYRLLVL